LSSISAIIRARRKGGIYAPPARPARSSMAQPARAGGGHQDLGWGSGAKPLSASGESSCCSTSDLKLHSCKLLQYHNVGYVSAVQISQYYHVEYVSQYLSCAVLPCNATPCCETTQACTLS
jgi:hypothetical protein